jgi:hypothetical protein
VLATIQSRTLSSRLLSENVNIRTYKTVILPVILNGCDIEGGTLKMPENRVLRGTYEQNRDEAAGGLREVHKEKPHDFYSSPSIIRKIKSRRMR